MKEFNFSEISDDPIEEAFIEDLIPYEYEIKEISINDKKPPHKPQSHLTKNGLQLGWNIKDLKKEESLSIKYLNKISKTR